MLEGGVSFESVSPKPRVWWSQVASKTAGNERIMVRHERSRLGKRVIRAARCAAIDRCVTHTQAGMAGVGVVADESFCHASHGLHVATMRAREASGGAVAPQEENL